MNICSLGFRDVRECVTLWRLILRSLGCTCIVEHMKTFNVVPIENTKINTNHPSFLNGGIHGWGTTFGCLTVKELN